MFTEVLELKQDVKYLIILRWGGGESSQVSYTEQNGGFWGFDSPPSLPIQTQRASGFLSQQV